MQKILLKRTKVTFTKKKNQRKDTTFSLINIMSMCYNMDEEGNVSQRIEEIPNLSLAQTKESENEYPLIPYGSLLQTEYWKMNNVRNINDIFRCKDCKKVFGNGEEGYVCMTDRKFTHGIVRFGSAFVLEKDKCLCKKCYEKWKKSDETTALIESIMGDYSPFEENSHEACPKHHEYTKCIF